MLVTSEMYKYIDWKGVMAEFVLVIFCASL